MSFTIKCSGCGTGLVVDERYVGKTDEEEDVRR